MVTVSSPVEHGFPASGVAARVLEVTEVVWSPCTVVTVCGALAVDRPVDANAGPAENASAANAAIGVAIHQATRPAVIYFSHFMIGSADFMDVLAPSFARKPLSHIPLLLKGLLS